MKKIFLLLITAALHFWVLKAQTPCPNLVTNGDFETSNANFVFGYPLNAGCVFGSYNITTNFNLKCTTYGRRKGLQQSIDPM